MAEDVFIGKQLGDHLILSKLGEGGMASVYKARHTRLKRDDAIKVILPQVDDSEFKARFENEAQLIASLNHPNIVPVYNFGEVDTITYLVMQYVGGGTLSKQLHNGQRLTPRLAAQYALQMARALHHAHQKGIVHRDVKPQNMLISANDPNLLLLSDFGIAKIFDSSQEETRTSTPNHISTNPLLTSADIIVGTATYMAPEQANKQPLDARTDVYALGVVLYQMLTGQVPFQATTRHALMLHHVRTPPRPVRDVNPNIPESLAHITEKALQKAPDNRFQSAEAMAQALEAALASAQPQAKPASSYLSDELAPTREQSAPLPPAPSTYGHSTPSHSSQPPSYDQRSGLNSSMSNTPILPLSSQGSGVGNLGIPIPAPARTRPRQRLHIQTIAAIIISLLALIFTLSRVWPSASALLPLANPTPSAAKPFTETFQNNNNNWIMGDISGLQATLNNGSYNLTTDKQDVVHFSYPRAIGTLPADFSLTMQVAQNQGNTNIAYGLAYHVTYSADGTLTQSCYALIIDSDGSYQLLRYDTVNSKTQATTLWMSQSSAIRTGLHQTNVLQAIVQGSSSSFKINNQTLTTNTGNTFKDTTYSGGQIGLLVAGPNTSFTVSNVTLTIP